MGADRKANGSNGWNDIDEEVISSAVEGLVGTPDPQKLVSALGYRDLAGLLAAHHVESLGQLLFQGDFLENMTLLRVDLFREQEGYSRINRRPQQQPA